MENSRLSPKNILGLFLILIITVGFTALFIHFTSTIKDTPVEETIENKYSKKGLYLYPCFEIMVTNSERPSTVTKEQYESMKIGDSISGYKKNDETFVTDKDIQFEISLGIVILIFLYLVIFIFVGILLKNTTFIKKGKKRQNILYHINKVNFFGVLIIFIIIGMAFTVLVATNAFHKLNTWNQITVEGTIIGGDYNETRGSRGASYTTYELFIRYEGPRDNDLITKKAVTENTNKKYDVDKTIHVATNAIQKLNAWNQITVEGTIIVGDYNEPRGCRGASYTTYELVIRYEGPRDNDLITKKAVTENTYKKYDVDKTIPLAYRQNNEYDTFISVKDFGEIWQAFVNLMMLFLSFYFIAMFFIIKAWRKERFSKILAQLKSNDDDEEEKFTEFETEESARRPWDENPPEKASTIENIRSNLASWNDKYRAYQNKPGIEQNTRTWERRTLWILAGLALIAGSVVFPFSSIDHNGKIFMNVPLLIILVSTFLIPVVFAF